MPRVRSIRRVGLLPCCDILNVQDVNCYALSNGVVSHNSSALDEVNFMRVKSSKETGKMLGQAYELYNSTRRRIISRYMRPGGSIPGIMLLVSSRASQSAFMEEHLLAVTGKKYRPGMRGWIAPGTYLSDYALWETKPSYRFSKRKFTVEVGDRYVQSRILTPADTPRPGAHVVEVPEDFRRDFERDTDQALRDIAGIATLAVSPLLRDRQSLADAVLPLMRHPFTREALTLSTDDPLTIQDYFDTRLVCRIVNSVWRPLLHPEALRYLHVDIGLRGDCAGISMVHQWGTRSVTTTRPDGTQVKIDKPMHYVDFMLRVVPPASGEIDLSKIRSFILFLRTLYPVVCVTLDGFQSADTIQLLRKERFTSYVLSLDRTDKPYMSLRNALVERRIKLYEYRPFVTEMVELERDIQRGKVDHPEKSPTTGGPGSKDVADAVAGALWACLNDAMSGRAPHPVISAIPAAVDDSHSDNAAVLVGEKSVVWSELERNLQTR